MYGHLDDVYCVPDDRGLLNVNRSAGERDLALYMQHVYRKGVNSVYTCNKMPRIQTMYPDIVIERENNKTLVVNYYGCITHAHTQKIGCLEHEDVSDDTLNYLQQTYGEVQRRNNSQIWKLKQLNFETLTIWQCHWNVMKNPNSTNEDFLQLPPEVRGMAPHVQIFFKHYYKPRPMERLIPRQALKGGRVEYLYLFVL